MKAYEIMEKLFAFSDDRDYSKSCDTCKAGDPNKEVCKVAVSMFATPDVVREASNWGAQLLIVHEPTYYNHPDYQSDEKIECEKCRSSLKEECKKTVDDTREDLSKDIKDLDKKLDQWISTGVRIETKVDMLLNGFKKD